MIKQRAEQLAREAHEGTFRRDGVRPYIVHPEAVASRVESDSEKATAWLHDVIEDTSVTAKKMEEVGIPSEVVEAVSILTKTKGQSYEDYLLRVKNNPLAKTVKIADMLSNLADTPTERQILKYAKGLIFLLS